MTTRRPDRSPKRVIFGPRAARLTCQILMDFVCFLMTVPEMSETSIHKRLHVLLLTTRGQCYPACAALSPSLRAFPQHIQSMAGNIFSSVSTHRLRLRASAFWGEVMSLRINKWQLTLVEKVAAESHTFPSSLCTAGIQKEWSSAVCCCQTGGARFEQIESGELIWARENWRKVTWIEGNLRTERNDNIGTLHVEVKHRRQASSHTEDVLDFERFVHCWYVRLQVPAW